VAELLFIAGLFQLVLALGSLAIPVVLGWREETARLRPLTRQVFWVYAAYIWGSHVAFGLVSVLEPATLLEKTTLAAAVSGFIALWWAARLAIQFALFHRCERPKGLFFAFAEAALVFLFFANTLVYGSVACRDLLP
jgi:hypothetical protein